MKILLIHQYFLLPGHPGGSRFNEFARFWSAAGHDVTVIAGNQDYSSGDVPRELSGKWLSRTQQSGATVWRCHVPRSYNSGTLGRIWAFAGFTVSSCAALLRCQRPDVVITTSPPLTVAVTGWLASRLRFRGAKWVFEVRDLWPESAVSTGVLSGSSPLIRFLYWLESKAYQHSDLINVLTPAFREDITHRGLADAAKISLIPNGADLAEFSPGSRNNSVRASLGWGERFVVLYAGAHGRANAVHQLIEAAAVLVDRPDILIACVGDGPERRRCEAAAIERSLTNIQFLGPVAKDRMPDYINAADAGAAVLQNNPTFRTVYPNKIFDYMACARPVLLAIDGVARALVCGDAEAGLFAQPEDGLDIAQTIRRLADSPDESRAMGSRGRDWVEKNASRQSLAKRYLKTLEGLVSCTSASVNVSSTSSQRQPD